MVDLVVIAISVGLVLGFLFGRWTARTRADVASSMPPPPIRLRPELRIVTPAELNGAFHDDQPAAE